MNSKKIGAIVLGITLAGGTLFGLLSMERVKPGYVGVVYSMSGGIEDSVLTQGWKFVGPTKKVTQYSVATEQLYMSVDEKEGNKGNDSFDVTCKDGKLNVDFEMSYCFDADMVPKIFTRYRGMSGEDVVNNIIRGKVKTFVNEVTSQYTVLEAHLEKKGELNRAIAEHLKTSLADFGLTVESANLTQTRPDAAVAEAITKRSAAAQELEAEKQKQEKVALEAETKRIEAQGKADAKLIEAEAEAKANKILQESLTPELIEKMRIEKWNGSNATTVVGEGTTTVVNTQN